MNNCNQKIKQTCGSTVYATCTAFEGTPNSQSELANESCLDVNQTTQDLYDQLETVIDNSDLSELGQTCLSYTTVGGKIFVKNALLKMEEEICTLKAQVQTLQTTAICDMSLADCGLDLECLTLPCDNEINTLKDLLQALITKSCAP